jgi:molybdenum cofactor synthesis domain-containing protein
VAAPTAAIVVVGNEVLSAKTADENGPWAARRLREMGVRLRSVTTVLDRVDEVVEAVDRERRRSTWVFTSGGIGPTHDDVTVRAVALALGRRMIRDPRIADAIRGHHLRRDGVEPHAAALRMADVPEGTRLEGDAAFPTMRVENVFMLAGVPRFFRRQLEQVAGLLGGVPLHLAQLFLGVGEAPVADALAAVAAANPDVEIGSYPRFDEGADHRVKITVECEDRGRVETVMAALRAALPEGALLREEGP